MGEDWWSIFCFDFLLLFLVLIDIKKEQTIKVDVFLCFCHHYKFFIKQENLNLYFTLGFHKKILVLIST